MYTVTNRDPLIDIRDVITQFEESESESLKSLLESLEGKGGDEEWEGNWYPITLIRDDYFETYAREFAGDTGALKNEMDWPYRHIDWFEAAKELQRDYEPIGFDGMTYWFR